MLEMPLQMMRPPCSASFEQDHRNQFNSQPHQTLIHTLHLNVLPRLIDSHVPPPSSKPLFKARRHQSRPSAHHHPHFHSPAANLERYLPAVAGSDG